MEYPPPGEGHDDLGAHGEVRAGWWRGRPVGPALASSGRSRGGELSPAGRSQAGRGQSLYGAQQSHYQL